MENREIFASPTNLMAASTATLLPQNNSTTSNSSPSTSSNSISNSNNLNNQSTTTTSTSLDFQKQRLSKLIELISEQEAELNSLKTYRKLAKDQTAINAELKNEINTTNNTIALKDKELKEALNKVDNLKRQLTNYRRTGNHLRNHHHNNSNTKNANPNTNKQIQQLLTAQQSQVVSAATVAASATTVATPTPIITTNTNNSIISSLSTPNSINNIISNNKSLHQQQQPLPPPQLTDKVVVTNNNVISPPTTASTNTATINNGNSFNGNPVTTLINNDHIIGIVNTNSNNNDNNNISDDSSSSSCTTTTSPQNRNEPCSLLDRKPTPPPLSFQHQSSSSNSNLINNTSPTSITNATNNSSTASESIHNNNSSSRMIDKSSMNTRKVSFDPLALLLDAAWVGELELVIKTSKQVADLSASHDECVTALHNAILAGHYDVAKYLIEAGCDVNVEDSEGYTPLHCAANNNNLPLVKLLVENNALLFATTTGDNHTPLMKCEQNDEGFEECYNYLLNAQNSLGVINGGLVYALYNYEAQKEDELSFVAGDELIILKKEDSMEQTWWWAKKRRRCHQKHQHEQKTSDTLTNKLEGSVENDEDEKSDGREGEGFIPNNLIGLYPPKMKSTESNMNRV